MADHLELDDSVDYLAGAFDVDRAASIERHLSGCAECVAQTNRVLDAARAWDEWTAIFSAASGRQGLCVLLAASADAAQTHGEDLGLRIRRWIRAGAEIAVTVCIPRLGRVPSYVVGGLESLINADTRFELDAASTGRFRGDDTAGGLQGPFLEIPGTGRRRARIITDVGERTTLKVQIDNYPADHRPPLVAAVVAEAGDTVVLKAMTPLDVPAGTPPVVDLEAHFDFSPDASTVQIFVEPSDDR